MSILIENKGIFLCVTSLTKNVGDTIVIEIEINE